MATERPRPDTALRAALVLWRAPGVGARQYLRLIERFGSAEAVLAAAPGTASLPALADPDWAGADQDLAWAAADPRRAILRLGDEGYPPLLAQIPDPPPLLFVQGNIRLLHDPQLAMVGSRNPSHGGAENAFEFARHLAGAGLAVTSGLALGIDAAAHRGALAGGGGTVAVLGTGPDRIYPARHLELARAIVDGGGALVTELPTGVPPRRDAFPRRNRIISGLSLGTLVVEAALQSGSLITARMANEQGREVFAIPGSIHNPVARGCHRLIREGAKLVETARDILEELAPQLTLSLQLQPPGASGPAPTPVSDEAAQILAALGHDPVTADQLVERSRLTADTVSSILLLLELEGYVVSVAGRYSRTSKRVADEAERV